MFELLRIWKDRRMKRYCLEKAVTIAHDKSDVIPTAQMIYEWLYESAPEKSDLKVLLQEGVKVKIVR